MTRRTAILIVACHARRDVALGSNGMMLFRARTLIPCGGMDTTPIGLQGIGRLHPDKLVAVATVGLAAVARLAITARDAGSPWMNHDPIALVDWVWLMKTIVTGQTHILGMAALAVVWANPSRHRMVGGPSRIMIVWHPNTRGA